MFVCGFYKYVTNAKHLKELINFDNTVFYNESIVFFTFTEKQQIWTRLFVH